MTAIFPEIEFEKNMYGTEQERFAVGESTGEFPISRPVSLTRVLKLRCTFETVSIAGQSVAALRWFCSRATATSPGCTTFENSVPKPVLQTRLDISTRLLSGGGGPLVRSAMVAQMMPHVVCESLKIELDLIDAAEVMLTDVLHEVFEELFHDIETVRSGLIQKVHDAGGNLMALGAIVERVDALTIPEIPTEAEIVRDLFLGYAYSQRMHIQGTRLNLERAGRFYRSQEVCEAAEIHAQGICSVLNRLPDVDLPGGRGDLLQQVEFYALG